MPTRRSFRLGGFTLIELLVVIAIILIVSAATLPVVLPALNQRQVNEAARILQANIAGTRDAAIRANQPRGLRFLLDPTINGPTRFAFNRMISIEPAPEYHEGFVTGIDVPPVPPIAPADPRNKCAVKEQKKSGGFPSPPTSWFYNIRQGDKIRINNSGRYYTIAGPIKTFTDSGRSPFATTNPGNVVNSERFINFDRPPDNTADAPQYYQSLPNNNNPEFLFLVNGQDDDGDGYVDEGFDGLDNDGDGVIDPGFNGLDDDGDGFIDELDELGFNGKDDDGDGIIDDPDETPEWEPEQYVGSIVFIPDTRYTIVRRPVVAEGAREVALPPDVVIDVTTWNTTRERSRLPIDPFSGTVDILIAPNGQVVPSEASAGASSLSGIPFYHFWLADRADVVEPVANSNPLGLTPPAVNLLPMPSGTPNYPPAGPFLTGERRLVTLFTRTGLITTTSIVDFDPQNVDRPYITAQSAAREPE